jgi:NitT/TauT family transport system permease protein
MTRGRWLRYGSALLAIAALELVCRLGWVRPTTLVPPTIMVAALGQALSDPDTQNDFLVTLGSVAITVVLSTVLGIAAGIVLHATPRWRHAAEPFIASYYALPLFALYPVLVVVLGVGTRPIIATGVLYALMSVLMGTLTGLDRIPVVFRKCARVHRLDPFATAWRVLVPACAPDIAGAIALSVSYAFVAVIASEFLLASQGVGHAIADAYDMFQTARMYGLMLGLGVCVATINIGLGRLRARFGPSTA